MPGIGGQVALEHLHRYALAQHLARGQRVLDIACGEGYGADMLAQVAASVIGVDIDPVAVAHASATYRRSNLRFCQGSCTSLELPDASIDLAVSFETLEHHADHDGMLAELQRVLVPDGVLIISTPDRRHYSDELNFTNAYHVRELYAQEFFELILRHFPCAAFFGQRVVYGSLVAPIQGAADLISFCKTKDGVATQTGLTAPPYLVAVASARPVPTLPASIFDGTKAHTDETNKLRQDRQVALDLLSAVHASLYWRMAAPVRWLRRALRRWQVDNHV